MRCLILFGVSVVGCSSGEKGDFTPLSCTDDVGDDGASDDQRVGLDAANCYRNLMGLEAGVLGSQVNTATQSHAEYMSGAGKISHQQSQGRAGYTGEWVWDRIASDPIPDPLPGVACPTLTLLVADLTCPRHVLRMRLGCRVDL